MSELNRRLLDEDNNVIYPITKAENILHLQKTVLPKLSDIEPEIKVKGKVWLDPIEDEEETNGTLGETLGTLTFGIPSSEPLTFGSTSAADGLTFASTSSNEELTFGTPSDEELTFGDETEELTFGAPSDEPLTFGN